MKTKLLQAKDLLAKGDAKGALDLLKSLSVELKGFISKCPGCGADVTVLEKNSVAKGECAKCGAVFGNTKLVKIEEGKSMTKKEIVAKLWELYRVSDPDVDAFTINSFAATGWLKKSLAVKLGLPLPEEKLEKAVGDGKDAPILSGKGFSEYWKKNPQLKWHVAMQQFHAQKEGKVEKSESPTREDILDAMLQMAKNREASELIHRRSIAKFESTGEISDEVLKTVYKKLGRDFYELNKKEAKACTNCGVALKGWEHGKTLGSMHTDGEYCGAKCVDAHEAKLGVKKTSLVSESSDGVKRGRDALPPEMEGKEELKDQHVGALKPVIQKKK